MVDDAELLELVELEVRELLSASTSSRATTFPIIKGSALKALEGDPESGRRRSIEADGRAGQLHPDAGARHRQAVPDAGGRRLLDLRAAARW
jgi:hypothetical protein